MLRVHSRDVMPGDTFLALEGEKTDGHNYIEEAIDKGATCVIAQHGEYRVKTIIEKDTRVYLSKYLSELHADKLKKIELIGVTGSRGKTSCAYLIYTLLNSLGLKCAYIGSKGFYIEDKVVSLDKTTPDLYEMYDLITQAVNSECVYLVLEVTNLALKQRRLEGLKFKYTVFTNNDEDYLEDATFFEKTARAGYSIINADDKDALNFMLSKNKNILYGKQNCDYSINDINLYETHSIFNLQVGSETIEINLPLPCEYNIYNYVAAYIIASKIGIKKEQILLATPYLKQPNGRYQIFEKENIRVIVDNASTPSAIMSAVTNARKYASGKIIIVIGSKGTYVKEVRKSLGKAAIYYSDYVIFTSDSPYNEEPQNIINDMVEEIENDNFEVILDRRDAIKKGIGMLDNGDTLMVLGRGDESEETIYNAKFHLSDIEEVLKYMRKA